VVPRIQIRSGRWSGASIELQKSGGRDICWIHSICLPKLPFQQLPFSLCPRVTAIPFGYSPTPFVLVEKKAWLPIEYWEEEDPSEEKTEAQKKKEEALMNGVLFIL